MLVLVTGSSKGIGKIVSEKFLLEGHKVIGLDILPSSIKHKSYNHFICDISKELPSIEGINILINNAGVQLSNEEDIDINLKATIRVTKKYAFQKDIKSVLFIASSSATTGAEFPEYAASKGGIVTYMKNVSQSLAKYSATVNSISPGGVITELNKHILEDKKLWNEVLNETLLNKWASPEEIADWAYFVTVVNKSMTGQDIIIDNGEFNKYNFVW